jgi:putative sigma-54 modulation protein
MQFSVTFRHMEATEALKSYARERLEKIRKYFPDPISVNVVMSTERGYSHRVDVTLQLHNGLTVAGHETTENMYSSIDLVAAKIERQVRKYKDRLRTHKGKQASAPVSWSHSVVTETEADAEVEEGQIAASALAEPKPSITKTEKFEAIPMSVDEAIMQLNLAHKQFLVFCHDRTGSINVVYRLEDDSYGLIETAVNATAETESA